MEKSSANPAPSLPDPMSRLNCARFVIELTTYWILWTLTTPETKPETFKNKRSPETPEKRIPESFPTADSNPKRRARSSIRYSNNRNRFRHPNCPMIKSACPAATRRRPSSRSRPNNLPWDSKGPQMSPLRLHPIQDIPLSSQSLHSRLISRQFQCPDSLLNRNLATAPTLINDRKVSRPRGHLRVSRRATRKLLPRVILKDLRKANHSPKHPRKDRLRWGNPSNCSQQVWRALSRRHSSSRHPSSKCLVIPLSRGFRPNSSNRLEDLHKAALHLEE